MTGHVMWQFQNSLGTALTSSLEPWAHIDESLAFRIDNLQEQGNYARLGESPYHQGRRSVGGALNAEAHPINLGFALKAALGQVETTSDTAKQIHVFDPLTSDWDGFAAVPPFTTEVYRDQGSAGLYHDLLAQQLELTFRHGELVGVSLEMIGGGFSRKAAGSPTFAGGKPFRWDESSWSINDVGLRDMRELTLRFMNQLEAVYTLQACSHPTRYRRTGPQKVELAGSFTFEVQSYWQQWEAGTELPLVGYLTGADSPTSLLIDVPALRFGSFEPNMGGPGMVEASFAAMGAFHAGSNAAIQITLENTKTFY